GPTKQALPGTRPLAQAAAGDTVQDMADKQGKGKDWQSIAAANNIENPRLLQPGQLLDLDASRLF
ncbi:MAG TPA: LysM domain-containing protein, partial [Pyrinomonadaceae bacterium]